MTADDRWPFPQSESTYTIEVAGLYVYVANAVHTLFDE